MISRDWRHKHEVKWRLQSGVDGGSGRGLSGQPKTICHQGSWQGHTRHGLSCWLCLFQRQKEDGISRLKETRRKVFIFASGEGLFGRKLIVRVSFEQDVCWKSRHCFCMKKYSFFFSRDGTQSSDSIFHWKTFRPQAFWTTSKHSVSCFCHSIISTDGSVLFALFAMYFNSTYSYYIANVANEINVANYYIFRVQ